MAKLDIFFTLKHLSTKNRTFLEDLSEEEIKGFAAVVVLQWMAGTKSPFELYMLNELVNPFVFSLYKHPILLAKLMTIPTSGKATRYQWIKKTKLSSFPMSIEVIKAYYGYSTKNAKPALKCLSKEDVLELAEELGYQKQELAKLKKELKNYDVSKL